jgi:excisionase family DNA binding protein
MIDQHQPTESILLDYDQAQRFLGAVSRSTMKALIARGAIKSVTIGRRRLFPRSELERFVAERIAAK